MKKRILAWLMALCIAVSLFPVTALAAEEAPADYPTLPAGATLPAGVTLPTAAGEPTKIDLAQVPRGGSAYIFISKDGLKMGGKNGTLCETFKNENGYEFSGENGGVGVKVDEDIDVKLILNNVTMEGSYVTYFDVSLARTTMILKGENRLVSSDGGCILKNGMDDNTYYPEGIDEIDYNTFLIIEEDPTEKGSLHCEGAMHDPIIGSVYSRGCGQKTCGFCNLEIRSGTLELIAGTHTPAIGANCCWSFTDWCYTDNIKITGGTINASGGLSCSAIGSGWGTPVYNVEISGTADVTARGGSDSPAIGSGGFTSPNSSDRVNIDVKNVTVDLTDGAHLNLYGDADSNIPAIGNGSGPWNISSALEVSVVNNSEESHATIVYGSSPTNYRYDPELSGLTGTYDIGQYLVDQKKAGQNVYYVGLYTGEKRDNWFISPDDGKYRTATNNVISPSGGAPFSKDEINALTKPIYEIAKEQISHPAEDFTINQTEFDAINAAKVRGQYGSFPLSYTAKGLIDGVETTITATCTVYLLENSSISENPTLELGCNNARLDTGAAFDVETLRDETLVAGVNTNGTPADGTKITVTEASLNALNAAAGAGKLGKFPITFTYTDPNTDEEITVDSTITLQKPVSYKYEAAAGTSDEYVTKLEALLEDKGLTAPADANLYAAGEAIDISASPETTILPDTDHNGQWVFAGYYSGDTKLGSSVLMSDEIDEIVGRWVFTGDQLAVIYKGDHITEQTFGDLADGDDTPPYTGRIPTVSGFVFGGWTPAVVDKIAYDQVTGVTDAGEGAIVYTAVWRTAGTVVPPKVTGSTAYTVTVAGTPGQEYSIDGGRTWVQPGNYPLAGKPGRAKKVIFAGLTPNSPYTVLTRLPAKDGGSPSETKQADAHTVKYDAPQIADMFKEPTDRTAGDNSNPPYDQATNETVDVVVDDDGNYKIVLKKNIDHTVTLPTDLGDVDLDLNSHVIKGDDGTKASPDGKPGLKLEHPTDDPGPDTDLTVRDDSEAGGGKIIGGDGYSPDKTDDTDTTPPGAGGSGVNGPDVPAPDAPDDPTKPEPTITAGPGSTIKGGDGGDGKPPKPPTDPTAPVPEAPGGDGGDGIDGDVDVVIDGGDVSGGEGGEPGQPEDDPGKPGKPTDTPEPPKRPGEGGGSGGSTKYTLSFDENGGSYLAPVTRSSGTTVQLAGYLTYREGFAFEGWYLDAACTKPVSAVKLDRNITVYAKWRAALLSDLNSEDHFAYIVGYPDGTVRPEDGVTRAETATIFYRLLREERRAAIFTAQNDFSDVEQGFWYNKAVSSMARGGYILGYPDGTFGGDSSITRAEFATLLTRFFGVDNTAEANYTDVARGHWAYRHIATAQKHGYMVGHNGEFRPEDCISRAEVMATLNRLLSRGVDKDSEIGSPIQWPDNPPGTWYYFEVVEATNSHEHTGTRPSEDWPSLDLDYHYDIKHYENP